MAMGPKGDPNPTGSFQPPGVLGKFIALETAKQERSKVWQGKLSVCDSIMGGAYGTGLLPLIFFSGWGWGLGFSFVPFWLWFWVLDPEEAREGNELTHVRTSITGEIKKRGRERGRIWPYLPVYLGSTGLSSWGNGFIWVGEFRGILEGFSGYVLRGLSVYGCIVSASVVLWVLFRCFLGGSNLHKEKCSYLWHGFIYYVYKKKSLKDFLVECLDIRKLFLPLLPKTIRNDNKTNINY